MKFLSQLSSHVISTLQRYFYTTILILVVFTLSTNIFRHDVYAQSHKLSLAVPETMRTIFEDIVLPGFQEANPEYLVELRTISIEVYRNLQPPTSIDALETFLEATEQLASQADVLFMFPNTIGPENTRSGYFLDINSLVASDSALPTDDFYPSMLEAYSWDGGLWALPLFATPVVITYDPAAFDAIGLSYPTEDWTFQNYANAARQLRTETSPGMEILPVDLPAFFRILTEADFTDTNFPVEPDFDIPELANLYHQWDELNTENVVTSEPRNDSPLRFTRINNLVDPKLHGALLRGQASADIYSVAISKGTDDPEGAYELAVYLTSIPELSTVIPGAFPTRYSLHKQQDNTQFGPLYQQALENAVTPSDLQFGNYLIQIPSSIINGISSTDALQNAQIMATTNLDQASALHDTIQINITPVTVPITLQNKLIQFALFTGGTSLPEGSLWERTIEDFITNNPDIDDIKLNFIPSTVEYWNEIPKNDCVYGYSYTNYSDESLLPLDPLLDADPTFDPQDVIGNVMAEMQRGETTYAIPVAISPYILRFDREYFAQSNVPEPVGTWSVSEFIDTLQKLEVDNEQAPLYFQLNQSTPWELLMAAYGSAPVDYSTTPATLRFTDQETISSIRQVLDLAKEGLVAYQPMATYFYTGSTPSYSPPLIALQLFEIDSSFDSSQYGTVSFPTGQETIPVSFYSTSSFIFSHALYPEACYDWLREITRHPELFPGMPAYFSVINNQGNGVIYDETEVSTFRRYADMINAPDHVFISPFGLGHGEALFMDRAFDRYVLEDADLQSELALAQELTLAYRACMSIAERDAVDCLLETDPTIRDNIPTNVLGGR